MTHRAVLKLDGEEFPLNLNLTTIGHGSCDIVIDAAGTAALHAIVEFSHENNCYLLRDLSTEQGTFVNDRRMQAGSPSRLTHGDHLRFGEAKTDRCRDYQLVIEWPSTASTSAATTPTSATLFRSRPPPVQPQTVPQQHQQHPNTKHPSASPALPTVRLGRPTSAGPQIPGRRSASSSAAAAAVAAAAAASSEQRLTAVQFDLHCLQTEAAQRAAQFEELQKRLAASEAESRQRLGALEAEVAAKEAEVGELRRELGRGPVSGELRELDRLRKDASIAGGLLTQMQRDMTGKDATITRLAREIETLKETVKARDQRITSLLTKSPADAKAEAEARQARERELASLRARLREAEARCEARDAAARDLRAGLDDAHATAEREAAAARQLGIELETAKAQAVDRQRSERLVRVDLQQATSRLERLRNRLMSIAFGMPDAPKPEGLATDEQLLDAVSGAVEERISLRAEADRLRAALEAVGRARALGAGAAGACRDRLAEAFGRLADRGRSAAALADEVALLAAAEAAADAAEASPEAAAEAAEAAPLRPLIAAVLEDLRHQLSWQEETEAALEKCGASVRLSDASPAHHLAQLQARWSDTEAQLARSRMRLAELESRAGADLNEVSEKLRAEWESRLADALEAAATESRRECSAAVEAAVAAEAERRREAAEREAAGQRAALADLEAALKRRHDEEATRGRAIADELAEAREREAELQQRLSAAEAGDATTKAAMRELSERRDAEACAQREQLRAISADNRRLRDELEEAARVGGRLQGDLESARSEADGLRSRHDQQQRQLELKLVEQQSRPVPANASVKAVGPPTAPPTTPPTTPPQSAEATDEALSSAKTKLAAAETEVASLRRENAGIRVELARLATRLAEAEAAAAAANSLRESPVQKQQQQQPPPPAPAPQASRSNELEASRRRQRNAEAEAAAANARADKLTELMERQRDRLSDSAAQLEKQRGVIKKLKATLEARDAQAKELQSRLRQLKEERKFASAAAAPAKSKTEAETDSGGFGGVGGALESELAALGHQCRGERHLAIIQHQREALSELRQRLKDSELGRPTTNSHDHTVQQVALLKRELAEMRSRQALAETGRYSQSAAPAGDLDKELGSTGLARIATTNANLQTERSAHAQAAACLEASERCYLSLASSLASALRLAGPLPGQLPMSQAADPNERRRLIAERDKAVGLMSDRARQLLERAERKDQLLEGYDGDLARLRQALQLAEARAAQVDSLAEQLRARAEESELLRASIGRARTAAATTATSKRNGEDAGSRGGASVIVAKSRPKVADVEDGADGDDEEKEAIRKRAIRERMKRKDYEIASLKAELRSREKDLRNASTKLSRLQTSLGLPHESELLGADG